MYYNPGGCLGSKKLSSFVQGKTTNTATQITVWKEMSLFLLHWPIPLQDIASTLDLGKLGVPGCGYMIIWIQHLTQLKNRI